MPEGKHRSFYWLLMKKWSFKNHRLPQESFGDVEHHGSDRLEDLISAGHVTGGDERYKLITYKERTNPPIV